MDDRKENLNLYNQDLIVENDSISYRIFNYFYNMLKDKREISFLGMYILYILETIQLYLMEYQNHISKHGRKTIQL